MDLLQRDPTADQLQRLSRSLQSVRLDGEVLTVVATEKADCRWPEAHIQTILLARGNAISQASREVLESPSEIPEFVIGDHESEGDQSDISEVNLDSVRLNRGFHEL
jgi:hypothetical protein